MGTEFGIWFHEGSGSGGYLVMWNISFRVLSSFRFCALRRPFMYFPGLVACSILTMQSSRDLSKSHGV